MTIDELKQMLEDKKITQEQFDAMSKIIDPDAPNKSAKDDKMEDGPTITPEIKKLIQSEIDRATNKLGNDNKKLREELKAERQAKMTAEQVREDEIREKEEELAARERAMLEKENQMYCVKALKTAGLDDGSDTSLDLIDFVMADDKSVIDSKIKAFDKLIKKIVNVEIDKIYGENGRNPQKGAGGSKIYNPYAKETLNFTEQAKLEIEDPERAKQLQALAGESK